MKHLVFAAVLLVKTACIQGQPSTHRGEFATHPNGLMYSDENIKILRFIVDSLNLRFKSCDLSQAYYSCPQGQQQSIRFTSKKNNLKDIIRAMEGKASLHDIRQTYSQFIDHEDSIEWTILTGNGKEKEYFLSGSPSSGYDGAGIETVLWTENKQVQWAYSYYPKGKIASEYSLTCHYFPKGLPSKKLPDRYARLIQYVDCMIDTNSTIFVSRQSEDDLELGKKYLKSNSREMVEYLDKKMNQKTDNKAIWLTNTQEQFVMEHLKDDLQFRALLAKTIDGLVANKDAHPQLGALAAQLGMHDKALIMARSYRVVGFCSRDTRPREHALNIATLAAKAHNWDIFLRAHLDIMNDRFERMSDGSYAYQDRKTYLKELEELNLDVVDLMLGVTLRSSSVASNHYYGKVWRLGWALAESKERPRFEKQVLSMIQDQELDEFNRGLLYILYKSYISQLEEKEANEKIQFLEDHPELFPDFINLAIKEDAASRRHRG